MPSPALHEYSQLNSTSGGNSSLITFELSEIGQRGHPRPAALSIATRIHLTMDFTGSVKKLISMTLNKLQADL